MNTDELSKKYSPMTETAFLILFSLQRPKHGYRIMEFVKEVTNNRIFLGNGTLYGTISRMEKDGLITFIEEADQKKTFLISPLGEKILKNEGQRIEELHRIIKEGL